MNQKIKKRKVCFVMAFLPISIPFVSACNVESEELIKYLEMLVWLKYK